MNPAKIPLLLDYGPHLFLLEFGGLGVLKRLGVIILPARHQELKFLPASLKS